MDHVKIWAEMDRLAAALVEKGIPDPRAEMDVKDGQRVQVNIWGDLVGRNGAGSIACFSAETPEAAISAASAHIEAIPSLKERHNSAFQAKVAELIDFGNAHGIEAQWLNPLVETARALASNALTHEVSQ